MNGIFPWVQQHWDARAAGNFIGGGSGTGLLILATIGALLGGPVMVPVLVALALVGLGLSLVWLELGRPWRFFNVVLHPQTSWMTREALVAAPLFLLGLVTAFFDSTIALLVTAVVAGTFLYCQGRILMASKGIPAWRAPEIMALIIATGLAEGAGIYLVITTALGTAKTPIFAVAVLLLVGVVVRQIAWRRYITSLQDNAPTAALKVLSRFEAPFLAVGMMAPILLVVGALAIPSASGVLALLGGLCAVAGGWLFKFTLVTRAAYNQGYAVMHLPTRGGDNTLTPGVKPGW